MNRDSILDDLLAKSRNMAVPWYLITSYLYYVRDTPVLSDERFDLLCRQLDEWWDELEHVHKYLIDRTALRAGTAFHMTVDDYPRSVKDAACMLAGIPAEPFVLDPPEPKFTIIKKKKTKTLVFGRKD